MATVTELSAPYENHLLPVLPAGDGVCSVCHTFVVGDYERCYQCNEARRQLPATADGVDFVALAVKHQQLARDLWVYKGKNAIAGVRPRLGLSAVLWRWLDLHEDCLAGTAGVETFPIVTTVPSTSGRPDHPLDRVVGNIVGATRDRYQSLLRPRPGDQGDRSFQVDRFEVVENIEGGTPILLIDDTFTTGAHLQSAAAALREAGSGPVGALCLGRHFVRQPAGDPYRQAADDYYQRARNQGWNWDRCCLCA